MDLKEHIVRMWTGLRCPKWALLLQVLNITVPSPDSSYVTYLPIMIILKILCAIYFPCESEIVVVQYLEHMHFEIDYILNRNRYNVLQKLFLCLNIMLWKPIVDI
jgi:hypothetical protein